MQLYLKKCISEKNRIQKRFTGEEYGIDFLAKDSTSLYSPIIELQSDSDILAYNYAYIPDWGRYYFVEPENVKVIGANRYEVQLVCDSLSTFGSQLLSVPCVIDRTESYGGSPYIPSEAFVVNCKHKTDILKFTTGLNTTGQFILITAGG